MNILWFLDKELDVSLSSSARLATIVNLERNNDLTVVTGYRHKKLYFDYIQSRIHYLNANANPGMKRFFLYRNHLWFCREHLFERKYDAVLVNSDNVWLLRALNRFNRPKQYKIVLDIRTLPVDASPLRRLINGYLFARSLKYASRYCDGITYITEEMRRHCRETYRLPEHQSEVWCSAVDPERFKVDSQTSLKREIKSLKILYHGMIAKNRNIASVVRAVALLDSSVPVQIGLMGDGDGRDEIESLIKSHDLHDRVTLLDPVPHDQVCTVIGHYDIGILPFQDFVGWNTSSPLKLFEYLSCERPVIVTPIPAHTQVLGKNDFAFWARDASPEGIAHAIKKAYACLNELPDLGAKARSFIQAHYTWAKQIGKLESFLQQKEA